MARTNLGNRFAILLCSFVALPAAGGALPVGSPQNAAAVEGQWTWTSGSDRIASWRISGFHGVDFQHLGTPVFHDHSPRGHAGVRV
jgi:hypothetical protein